MKVLISKALTDSNIFHDKFVLINQWCSNEVIKTISSPFFFGFFYGKILSAQKRKLNQDQLTKQK